MSTIKVNAFQDTGGKGFYPNRVRGTITQVSTQTILGSDGVSSITDSGTGRTTFSFSNNFSNPNYTPSSSENNTATGTYSTHIEVTSSATADPITMSTSAIRISMGVDSSRVCWTIVGDM